MLNEIVENIQKDIEKQLNKIKPSKKIKKFNKKHRDLLYQNNKLTTIEAYIIFIETYAFTEALIKNGETKWLKKHIYLYLWKY